MIVRTFDADSRPTGIVRCLEELANYPRVLWQNRYMVQNFFHRELLSRFHGSILGAWWMLVQPLFMFCIYFVIFGYLYNRDPEGDKVAFGLYLFVGVVCFHALVEATSTCCNIVIQNGNLVKKVAFPSEALPISPTLVSLVVFLVGAVLALLIGAFTGTRTPDVHLVFLPIVLVLQFLLTLGIGLFLANANVFIRDVQQLWRIFATAWFFMSPVFWDPKMMVDILGAGPASLLFHANPAYSLLSAHRIALGGEIPRYGVVDFWGHVGVLAIWAVGFLVLGYTTFVANKHKHADIV